MRKLIILTLAFAMLMLPVSAENNAGITPDSFFWQGELLLEQLQEDLTFDSDKRVELQLQHAEERLQEMQRSSNTEPALNQYLQTMEKVNQCSSMSYQASKRVQASIANQTQTLNQYTGNQDVATALQTAKQTGSSIQQRQSAKIDENLQWWKDIVTTYPVNYQPVSVLDVSGISYDKIGGYVPGGVTQVYVVLGNGVAVGEYLVEKTETDITVRKGVSTAPQQTYTFTVQQLMAYYDYYTEAA